MSKIRLGIVGYGNLGKFLVNAVLSNSEASELFEISFVWNRSFEKMEEDKQLKPEWLLRDLNDFKQKQVDLIVEVAHPDIIATHGHEFLSHCDLFVGSPTAFADAEVEKRIRQTINDKKYGCYIPSGALWGANDIAKMGKLGTLQGLTITMKKHPSSMKLTSDELNNKLNIALEENTKEHIIYEGPVRPLCPLAPNNVNTMACAALAAENLGFDKTYARLVADSRLEAHVIEIELQGNGGFSVYTNRFNPAKVGAVTGNATYNSFLSSLLCSGGRGKGLHFV
ncbi:hypothetical protein ABK040_014139 [Willaertia magna]